MVSLVNLVKQAYLADRSGGCEFPHGYRAGIFAERAVSISRMDEFGPTGLGFQNWVRQFGFA